MPVEYESQDASRVKFIALLHTSDDIIVTPIEQLRALLCCITYEVGPTATQTILYGEAAKLDAFQR